ncbi:MAG: general stress protein, partial [Fischerella sp.]|nr:general stress protein [Fischerella sp.]
MALDQRKHAIGIFPSLQAMEQALKQLREAGLSLDKVSIIAKDEGRNHRIASKAGEVATLGAIAGGAAGSIVGLLEGLIALTIPGVGSVVAAGAFLANTLIGSGLG